MLQGSMFATGRLRDLSSGFSFDFTPVAFRERSGGGP